MALTEKIDAALATVKAAIAKERNEVLGAIQVAVAPLARQIEDLKIAIAELQTQVETGSAAQATLATLEDSLVPTLEGVAADIDAIVTSPEPEVSAQPEIEPQ